MEGSAGTTVSDAEAARRYHEAVAAGQIDPEDGLLRPRTDEEYAELVRIGRGMVDAYEASQLPPKTPE